MKLIEQDIPVEYPPLHVTSALNVTGGSVVQFFDGTDYMPNREGTPSSPIMLEHNISAVDPDGGIVDITPSTTFYADDTAITTGGGYTITGDKLLVSKNLPPGAVVIKAKTQFVDNRSGLVYERIDTITLRTLLKSDAQYQLELSQRGRVFFDGYRNPNTATTVTAVLKKGQDEVTSFTGITFKWLNSEGVDAEENELYSDGYSNGNRTLTVDKTYIDHELIRCEAWKGDELIAFDTVTFIRRFGNVRYMDDIRGIPIGPLTKEIVCTLEVYDNIGPIDVNAAFLVTWKAKEGSTDRVLGTDTPLTVPISSLNLKAKPKIYADVKRREAWGAVTDIVDGEEVLLTDEQDRILTTEMYGI